MTSVVTCAAAVQVAKGASDLVFGVIDEINSDPRLKIDAMNKASAESKAAHEEAMRRWTEGQEKSEAAFRRREEAANERIRIQKEANDKEVNAMTEKIRKDEEQHDVEVKKMNDEHSKKVLAMRFESKEAREKAEMEHRMEVDKIQNEHKKEKREAEMELAKIKEEGKLKIVQAEKEKDALSEERNKELTLFIKTSKELHEIHQQQTSEISKRKKKYSLENLELNKKQLAAQNQKKLEENHKVYENLISVLTIENSRNVIKEFERIAEHVTKVNTSLKQIKDVCLPLHDEEPTIYPGDLDGSFEMISSARNGFDYSKRMFSQFVINSNHTDPGLFDTCSDLISDMSKLMNAKELSPICVNLPRAIDNDKMDIVKKYGQTAESLFDMFSNLQDSLTNGMKKLKISHLTSAPSSQNRAILKQNKDEI
ncbi:unnamed protein product [Caenorhabditis nigoni]